MGERQTSRLIILVGPKHSGKTSVGKMLAQLIGVQFEDLDERIEKRTGFSPRALYEKGVDVFREAEAEAAKAIISEMQKNETTDPKGMEEMLVVAAGGGLSDNFRALSTLREAGILVYLEVGAKTAWERVLASAKQTGSMPPFLRGENPEEAHRALHERRAAAYREISDLKIDAEGSSPATIAATIAAIVGASTQKRA